MGFKFTHTNKFQTNKINPFQCHLFQKASFGQQFTGTSSWDGGVGVIHLPESPCLLESFLLKVWSLSNLTEVSLFKIPVWMNCLLPLPQTVFAHVWLTWQHKHFKMTLTDPNWTLNTCETVQVLQSTRISEDAGWGYGWEDKQDTCLCLTYYRLVSKCWNPQY